MAIVSCALMAGINGIKWEPKDQAMNTPAQNRSMLFVNRAASVKALASRIFSCFGIFWVRIVNIVRLEIKKPNNMNKEKPDSE